MAQSPVSALSVLSAPQLGVFRGGAAIERGVSRRQLDALRADGVIARVFPDTYRMTVVDESDEQRLRAALLWASGQAMGAGRSAGAAFTLEGVRAAVPEIAVPRTFRGRTDGVAVYRVDDLRALMPREVRRLRVTGIETTLVRLAYLLDDEAFEVACEDARRRRLATITSLHAYLERYARPGQRGIASMRALLREGDPVHPSRSTLEVKTRRLLVSHGLTDFEREWPLEWEGRTYRYDFAFVRDHVILETNGRRWHDDPTDYEDDNEKWSVPGRHGFKIVLATWNKVTRNPLGLIGELHTTLAP
jgi:hypothetical protein